MNHQEQNNVEFNMKIRRIRIMDFACSARLTEKLAKWNMYEMTAFRYKRKPFRIWITRDCINACYIHNTHITFSAPSIEYRAHIIQWCISPLSFIVYISFFFIFFSTLSRIRRSYDSSTKNMQFLHCAVQCTTMRQIQYNDKELFYWAHNERKTKRNGNVLLTVNNKCTHECNAAKPVNGFIVSFWYFQFCSTLYDKNATSQDSYYMYKVQSC